MLFLKKSKIKRLLKQYEKSYNLLGQIDKSKESVMDSMKNISANQINAHIKQLEIDTIMINKFIEKVNEDENINAHNMFFNRIPKYCKKTNSIELEEREIEQAKKENPELFFDFSKITDSLNELEDSDSGLAEIDRMFRSFYTIQAIKRVINKKIKFQLFLLKKKNPEKYHRLMSSKNFGNPIEDGNFSKSRIKEIVHALKISSKNKDYIVALLGKLREESVKIASYYNEISNTLQNHYFPNDLSNNIDINNIKLYFYIKKMIEYKVISKNKCYKTPVENLPEVLQPHCSKLGIVTIKQILKREQND